MLAQRTVALTAADQDAGPVDPDQTMGDNNPSLHFRSPDTQRFILGVSECQLLLEKMEIKQLSGGIKRFRGQLLLC